MFRPHVLSRTALLRAGLLCAIALLTASVLFAQAGSPTPASDSVGRRRIQPLPALGSAPETGLQFGATVLAVWEPAPRLHTRPASLLASALRTTKAQTRVRIEGEHWSTGNARRLAGSLQWQEFPLPFFGIGDRTPRWAEEIYTPTGTEAVVSMQQRISGPWYASVGARYLDQTITADSIGVLRLGQLTGSSGGVTAEFSAGVQRDTRDNLFAPRAGQWLQLVYSRSDDGLWSDFSYRTLKVDARSYHTLGASHVVALQAQVTGVDGDAPFDALALVGNGDIMRGYQRGRYRDAWLTAAQAEYRSPVWHRLGGVAFAGAGLSSPGFGDWSDRRVLPTYGAGLRVQIDARQRTGVRADYGRGLDGASGLYIGFNQAF
ncbi:MAG: BamA/TamA family outer membrane protein [Gemmatimonadota bacterium]